MPNHHLLCAINDLADGASKSFSDPTGQTLFCIRQGQQVHGYYNRCPHLGLPLEWQADQFLSNDETLIQCATHGALFEIDSGKCIYGPCQGQYLEMAKIKLEDGKIWLDLT